MNKPVTEVRRDRLKELIAEFAEGNQAEFSRQIGKSRAQVGFWLTAPDKPHAKQMSHATVRALESKFGKPTGWMDTAARIEREARER